MIAEIAVLLASLEAAIGADAMRAVKAIAVSTTRSLGEVGRAALRLHARGELVDEAALRRELGLTSTRSAERATLASMSTTPIIRIESKPVPHRYRGRKHASIERGAPQVPYAVVVHWTAGWGEVDGLWNYLRRQGADESYNYAIDRSGRCAEFVPGADAAWHAGDGNLPPVSIVDSGFVAGRDVQHVKRITNLRSIGIANCNRGWLTESGLIEAHHRKALIVDGLEHNNPRCASKTYEGYHDATIATWRLLLAKLKLQHPQLRIVLGHEDTTNYDALGVAGSKTDPGPAFPWRRLGLRALGLLHVQYDFRRHGWAVVDEPDEDLEVA